MSCAIQKADMPASDCDSQSRLSPNEVINSCRCQARASCYQPRQLRQLPCRIKVKKTAAACKPASCMRDISILWCLLQIELCTSALCYRWSLCILCTLIQIEHLHPALACSGTYQPRCTLQDSDFQFGVKQYLVAAGAMVLIININVHYAEMNR